MAHDITKGEMMKNTIIGLLLTLVIFSSTFSDAQTDTKPGPKDKCPVCGMFVQPYPDWLAEMVFQDGSIYYFDGVKDLAKFYLKLDKYAPQKNIEDIKSIMVTEYYGLKMIDAKKAYFVMGSDILGPMGRELIPCLTKEDAEVFRKDHKGKKILQFHDINLSVLDDLN